MRSYRFALALAPALLSCLAFSQPAKPPASASTPAPATRPDFHDEALVFNDYSTTWRYHPDGTGESIIHVSIRIQSEAAVRQFGVLTFSFASDTQTPHINYVRVHKPDGATIETPPSEAIDMASQVSREAPLYSDLKEKHLPVRSLSAGDTLEYELQTTLDKPEAPNHFWGAYHFTIPGSLIILSESLTLELPKDKYVQVWSPNHKPDITEHDNLRIYHWTQPQLTPAPRPTPGSNGDQKSHPKPPKDPDEDADNRKLPSIAWTTFHTWAEVGDWYRSLAASRAQPTDQLKARADEITKDAKTPEAQIQAIYQFVSQHTRYIGIDFGTGRYQPHAAAEVLANQYGDCKDKDTLLESLLRAKGFKTAPALIGAGIVPISDLPSPATFNHVITTVTLPNAQPNSPETHIWLDSTPETTPYRYLSAALRDESALIVPSDAPAKLEKTPVDPPYPLESHFQAAGTLDSEGKFTAKITTTYRTDEEGFVRGLARGIAPAEWDKASQYISSVTGFGGATSETRFPAPDNLTQPIEIDYTYTRHPYGDWDNHRIIPPFPIVDLTLLNEDEGQPDTDIELGAPRTLYATSTIQLPNAYTTDLPDSVHIKAPFALFDQTYRFDGRQITVDRKIVILQKKLPKEQWKQYLDFTKNAHLDNTIWIRLEPPNKTETFGSTSVPVGHLSLTAPNVDAQGKLSREKSVTIAPSASSSSPTSPTNPDLLSIPADATPEQLLQQAQQLVQAKNWDLAQTTLDRVKDKSPTQPNLWRLYGLVAEGHNDLSAAEEDFKKELSAHPDDPTNARYVSSAQYRAHKYTEANATLAAFLSTHPNETGVAIALARMQTARDDNDSALQTLQTAAAHTPNDHPLQLALSQTLLRANHTEQAAAAAKTLLEAADDPQQINSAAYVLAQTGLDLSTAEAASRKNIAALEDKSQTTTAAEANSNTFANSRLLIASWDTLGWILFRQGKLAEAELYIVAAWRNNLHPEVGDHLGQLYEAQNKPLEAYEVYDQAANSTEQSNLASDIKRHLSESSARLHTSNAPVSQIGREGLLQSRTYRLTGYKGVSGWSTLRLEITAAGLAEALQISGEPKLANLVKTMHNMQFPDLVPPTSKAHLLRSGVLSCSTDGKCELVLVPNSDLRTERY